MFSSGQHRKVIVLFAPPNRLGFRLLGEHNIHWITAGAGYFVAVQNGAKFKPAFNIKELLEKAKEEAVLPFPE